MEENQPPDYVIEEARRAGAESPCAKSKRGVVLFDSGLHAARVRANVQLGRAVIDSIVISSGFNGPPEGFTCSGTMMCKSHCRDVCVHAEARAILAVNTVDQTYLVRMTNMVRQWRFPLAGLDLVHVKVVDGAAVSGGPPSCLQCSTLIVEVGLRGVWLLEAQRWHTEVPCESCSAITIIQQGDGTDGVCKRCPNGLLALTRSKTVYALDSGMWTWRSAFDFHLATLRNNGAGNYGSAEGR